MIRVFLPALLALVASPVLAQIPANGSFEAGLAGWTVGGTGQVADIAVANLPCCIATAPDGSRFAILSTGPGGQGGAGQLIDGNFTVDDDVAELSTTLNFDFSPAFIAFAWTFATSEEDQSAQYDDVFDVFVDGNLVLARSSARPNAAQFSNYPDAPLGGLPAANRLVTGAPPVTNTNLRYGIPPFQVVCVPIPGTQPVGNSMNFRVRIADQTDDQFDSAVLLDDVRVLQTCDDIGLGDLVQLTDTGDSTVELKGGGIEFRLAQATTLATDQDGDRAAFASSANLTGDNPNVIPQVFAWEGAAFSRMQGLTIQSGGSIHSLGMSPGASGRYVVVSAAPTASDNLEIWRWDRNNGNVQQLTTTAGCENVNPQVNDGGNRVVFESTCNALTGAGTRRKIVLLEDGDVEAVGPSGNCDAWTPTLSRNITNRYVAMASNCNPTSGNGNGNTEIFRWRWGNNDWNQVTSTGGLVVNTAPAIDDTGGDIYYLSNQYDQAGVLEIYRWDGGNDRITNSAGLATYLRVVPDFDDGSGATAEYGFERLDLTSFSIEVGHGRIDQPGQIIAAIGDSQIGLGFGVSGGAASVWFLSAGNPTGDNADGNFELFRYREP